MCSWWPASALHHLAFLSRSTNPLMGNKSTRGRFKSCPVDTLLVSSGSIDRIDQRFSHQSEVDLQQGCHRQTLGQQFLGTKWFMWLAVATCYTCSPNWGGSVVTIQALSGTGSLQCIAQFLKFMGVTKAETSGLDFHWWCSGAIGVQMVFKWFTDGVEAFGWLRSGVQILPGGTIPRSSSERFWNVTPGSRNGSSWLAGGSRETSVTGCCWHVMSACDLFESLQPPTSFMFGYIYMYIYTHMNAVVSFVAEDTYPYWHQEKRGLDFEGMMAGIQKMQEPKGIQRNDRDW